MVLVNGQVCDSISVTNRGLNYGDGIFRTLKIENGEVLCWERHYKKLVVDCSALSIVPPSRDELEYDIKAITKADPNCVLKIVVTRGNTTRGYNSANAGKAIRVVVSSPTIDVPEKNSREGVKIRLCNTRIAQQPLLAGIKHLNRLENVLARSEWSDPKFAEGLMLDYQDNVIEGTITNIFLVRDHSLITPDLSLCGVSGVQRDRVIEYAQERKIRCLVKNIRIEELLSASELFLVNSVIGLWPVREFLDHTWDTSRYTISPSVGMWLHDQKN